MKRTILVDTVLPLLSANWWQSMGLFKQAFWSLAIVSSFLLLILFILSLYRLHLEQTDSFGPSPEKRPSLSDPKTILLLFTVFSWSAVLFANWFSNLFWILAPSAAIAWISTALQCYLIGFIRQMSTRRELHAEKVLDSTGKVLQSIPPHRNGFGKVHLNIPNTPFEIEAITAGQELPPGAPIRVIDILTDRVLLVEPIQEEDQTRERM